jgi:hypothetical protein
MITGMMARVRPLKPLSGPALAGDWPRDRDRRVWVANGQVTADTTPVSVAARSGLPTVTRRLCDPMIRPGPAGYSLSATSCCDSDAAIHGCSQPGCVAGLPVLLRLLGTGALQSTPGSGLCRSRRRNLDGRPVGFSTAWSGPEAEPVIPVTLFTFFFGH